MPTVQSGSLSSVFSEIVSWQWWRRMCSTVIVRDSEPEEAQVRMVNRVENVHAARRYWVTRVGAKFFQVKRHSHRRVIKELWREVGGGRPSGIPGWAGMVAPPRPCGDFALRFVADSPAPPLYPFALAADR